ncbi:MAG: hypothetical protein ACRC68_12510 [Clostridium sp.]
MNKKQIYILSLLISLMFVLACMQQIFSEDIRKVAFRNNGVKNFAQYSVNKGEYRVVLPEEWLVEEEESIDDKEIDVKFNSHKIQGDIKILNNLDSISEVDSKLLKDVINKKYYEYKSNGVSWKVIEYQVKDNDNTFENKSYYREFSEGKVILINFKYMDKKIKPSMKIILDEIINNFR